MSFNSVQTKLEQEHQQRQQQLDERMARERERIELDQLRDAMGRAGAEAVRAWAETAHGRAGGFWNRADMTPQQFALLAADPGAAATHAVYEVPVKVPGLQDGPGVASVSATRHALLRDGDELPAGARRVGSVAHFAAQASVAAKRRLRVWLQSERDRRAAEANRSTRDVTR